MAAEWAWFEEQLADAKAIIDRKSQTDLAIFSGCSECVWQNACYSEAKQRNDVTLVADLRRKSKPDLNDEGIITISDLAAADPELLTNLHGIGSLSAERLGLQAQAQATEQVIRLGKPKLPKSQIELYYDIEGEPALDMDYLHGLLIVEPSKEPRYVSFVAEQPEDERQAFRAFVKHVAGILARHPKAPIFHYHWYERTHVKKLFERYPRQAMKRDELLDCFVDLHEVLRASFVLPVEGYGLKPVSKWLGFEYRNTKSSATQSMLWYRLWLETGDRQFLDDSITYNEDDCRATHRIRDYLLNASRRR